MFTFTAKRTKRDPRTGRLYIKGKRYPCTPSGWRRAFERIREAAGLPDFRFHDMRHTAATRTLAATGNLELVRLQFGHSTITQTAKYAKADLTQLRAALERTHSLTGAAIDTAGHTEGTQADGETRKTKISIRSSRCLCAQGRRATRLRYTA